MTEHFELDLHLAPGADQLRALPDAIARAVNPHIDRVMLNKIAWEDNELSGHAREWLGAFHQSYLDHEGERMDQLRSLLDHMGNPDDVIIMLYCSLYFPFFENWLLSCERAGLSVRDRTIGFALDESAAHSTSALGVSCYCFDPSRYARGGHSSAFGDPNFAKTVLYKNAIIFDLLKLGVNVLFQDADLIWLKDPFPYLRQKSESHDILAMYDGFNPMHPPYYANSGFMYVANRDIGRVVFETALRNSAMIMAARSHQQPLNRIFQHFVDQNVLRLRILPESLFLNGHLFNLESGISPIAGDWQKEAFVLHYSWTGGAAEKIMKLNKFDLNFVGPGAGGRGSGGRSQTSDCNGPTPHEES